MKTFGLVGTLINLAGLMLAAYMKDPIKLAFFGILLVTQAIWDLGRR